MQVSLIKPNYSVYFTALKRPLVSINKADMFERMQTESDDYYANLEKSMGIVTADDVKVKAEKVSKATGVNIQAVYKTMGLLSQYSSYKSLKFIENSLKQRGMHNITYLQTCKENNFPVCLTDVLAYIGTKNLNIENGVKRALVVDSKFLNVLNNADETKKQSIYDYIKSSNSELIYFENFENGYNFLNQEKDFEDFTIDVIEKAKKFQKHNHKSIEYNVRYVLNGENLKNMPAQVEVIKQENVYTPEQIADNLNPIILSKEDFNTEISKVSYRRPKAQKEILKFLNENMEVVTPQKYARYMKNIHAQLQDYLAERGKSMDDVYFIIPSLLKSFIPANYVYEKVNKTENSKKIFLSDGYVERIEQILQLPENAVAVIVDDCILSGLSMKDEVFPYIEFVKDLPKDTDIVFAPIVGMSIGVNELEGISRENHRQDKVICAKQLPDVVEDFDYLNLEYDMKNHSFLVSSLIFPYMGPDFNCDELKELYEKFFYSKDAQK